MTQKTDHKFDTLAVHAGYTPDATTGSRQVPIYATASFMFESAEDAADKFTLKKFGNVYSRLTNPTNSVLEQRLAALEGGVGATVTASGHAAQLLVFQALLRPGERFVASKRLYGGTTDQFQNTFPTSFGWQADFVDVDDLAAVKAAITPLTKLIFIESLANPGGVISDIEALAKIANEAGIVLVVDNTMASPYLTRPIAWGAHVVVHSTTKFLTGNGTAMGGAVIDGGNFDWKKHAAKYPELGQPHPSYNGLNFSENFGAMAFAVHNHAIGLRALGPTQSPFHSFLTLNGIETLGVRMDRHVSNAQTVAEWLEKHPQVSWVSYASLPSSTYYERAKKYMPRGAGAVFTFGVKGGFEAAKTFVDKLQLFSMLANIGDTRSLVIHPSSTTHSQLSDAHKKSVGVSPEAVRLSIGIEDVTDIIADLDQALLGAAAGVRKAG
ncbi:MAG: aminotransferase class I/II-fold pyridoxal phosphate-dependent enzyme [Alphaproteobacteria bacterium]|nr:aminotransferase class I/II-fold pyridoxal phosphate-dependent enzyme [Alphaproteobacteria bacterium]